MDEPDDLSQNQDDSVVLDGYRVGKSISTEKEISAWRRYHSIKAGFPDMLELLEVGKFPDPSSKEKCDLKASLKGDAIIENLKDRFKAGLTYSSIGQQILISVNPCDAATKRKEKDKELKHVLKQNVPVKYLEGLEDLEDEESFLLLLEEDKHLFINDPRANHIVQEHNQAHINSFTARCYWHMLRDREDQLLALILIVHRGETGSGKTTASKLFLTQLLNVSNQYSRKLGTPITTGQYYPPDLRLSRKLVAAYQLIEMMAHAQTPLNPSASRVHKYTELQFTKGGKIIGAKVVDFLLEKRRVAQSFDFNKNERNFNIFYMIFETGQISREEKEALYLLDSHRSYQYLTSVSNFGRQKFKKLYDTDCLPPSPSIKKVLSRLGLNANTQFEFLRILSAIILLGNVEYATYEARKEEGVYVKTTDILEKVSVLLGVSMDALETTLTQKTAASGGTLCADFLSKDEAKKFRDLFAITLYGLLFDYMMTFINKKMSCSLGSGKNWENWIGLFDFAGFENNSNVSSDPAATTHRLWHLLTNFADDRINTWVHSNIYSFEDLNQEQTKNVIIPEVGIVFKESMNLMNNLLLLYTHPENGILTITDFETIQGSKDNSESLSLAELFSRANQTKSKKSSVIMRKNFSSHNTTEIFLSGHSKSTFGIRHYGGAFNQGGYRVYYDVTDFCVTNSLGGRGKGSKAIRPDFVRLIKGTADFESARNKLLVSLIDKQLKVSTQLGEKTTIVKSTKMNEVNTLRSPSIRDDAEERKLTSVMTEKLNENYAASPLYKKVLTLKQESLENIKSQEKENETNTENNETKEKKEIKIALPTAATEFYHDLSTFLDVLQENGSLRHWQVFCIKPNDEFSGKKFSDEKVRDQIRRYELPLLLMKKVGEYSVSFTWRDFWARYSDLDDHEDTDDKEKRHGRIFDSNLYDMEPLKAKCRAIYEMFAIITGGGNGKIVSNDDRLLLNERAWWGLERNLFAFEVQKTLRKLEICKIEELEKSPEDEVQENQTVNMKIDDAEAKAREKRMREIEAEHISGQRKLWLRTTKFLTWWVPTIALRKFAGMDRIEVIQAWREKLALCLVIAFITLLMLFMIIFFSRALCPTENIFTFQDMTAAAKTSSERLVGINGQVYDMSTLGGHDTSVLAKYVATDISALFPLRDAPTSFPAECPPAGSVSTDYLSTTPDVQEGWCTLQGITYCHELGLPLPNVIKETESGVIYYGQMAYTKDVVATHSGTNDAWIIIDDKVYDLTDAFLNGALTTDDLNLLRPYLGTDATLIKSSLVQTGFYACMTSQFYRGVIDTRGSNVRCQIAQDTLLALTVVLCSVMLAKFLAALQFGSVPQPEDQPRYTIIQIPCYTEGEDSLKKTINSCARLDYDDDHKLLFIISDGLIKGSGNDRMTPEIVLDILGVENSHDKLTSDNEVKRYDYIALGDGMNRLNRAKVFSGFYQIETRRVPYIVVVKCGKESETRRPGNRGKRDSQLILMKFLNKTFYDRPMQPLEIEMYKHLNKLVGIDPNNYDYCLMVDADTEVLPHSLTYLIGYMINDSRVMGLCGETTIGNADDSWVTAIQVYEYYISHHLAKAFESLFGSVTCLPGCFCMYRIKSPARKPVPLLINDDIIHDYEENLVDTLHKKNLLSLGEDRYLTTLMLKCFPDFRNKFTKDATCRTIVPTQFSVLLSQRRRWINSTIHNLWELLLIPQLCGCLCFSMRFVVFLDLFGTITMPGALGYLGYLIYVAATTHSISKITMSLILFAAVYGFQVVIFLMRMKWEMIGWMVIYILSLPIYGFALPLYAFWHFDDFSWGNTRMVLGEKLGGHGFGADTEVFDEKSVVLKKYDVSKPSKQKKENRASSDEIMRSSRTLTQETAEKVENSDVEEDNSTEGSSSLGSYQMPIQVAPSVPPTFLDTSSYTSNSYVYPYYAGAQQYLQPNYYHNNHPANYYGAPSAVSMGNNLTRSTSLYVPINYQPGPVVSGPSSAKPPVSPISPHLISGSGPGKRLKDVLEKQGNMKDGLPCEVYPLPNSISPAFARIIFEEIISVLEVEDLRSLTKKKVRIQVEKKLQDAKEKWKDEKLSTDETDDQLFEDCKQVFGESGINFDLDTPERRSWLGKCVVEILKIVSQVNYF